MRDFFYRASNIVRMTEVNSNRFSDLGNRPIAVNYRLKKSKRSVESTTEAVITVISTQRGLQACNNETLVIHYCSCSIIRANNDGEKIVVNQMHDTYELQVNNSEVLILTIP